jgi:mannosyltransferase
MTSSSGPVVIGGAARKSGRAAAAQQQPGAARGYDPGPWWMRALPSAFTFVVLLAGITGPSYWRDEAATLAAVQRPFGDMVRMLGNVDAVHGAYYMFAWGVVRLFGTGELALRLPSAITMCIAAGFVAALGRRLVSPAAGLAAGLVLVLLPQIDFYGQDARSYAMVVMVAVIASYFLVRALQAPPDERRRWWFAYAAAIALLGILNIFGLLLVPANAVTVALRCRRPAEGESRRTLALSWLGAAAAGCVLASPLLYLAYLQRSQVSWLRTPDGLKGLDQLVGNINMMIWAAVIVAAGLIVSAIAGIDRLRAAWPAMVTELSLPWLILPPAILLTASLITPMYTFRYVVFCVPAVALLLGTGIAALSRIAGPVAFIVAPLAFIVLAALSFRNQAYYREPGGHKDDIRQADKIVAAHRQPGDQVLYVSPYPASLAEIAAAYPYGLDKLRNIERARAAIPSGTIAGIDAPYPVVRQRLASVSRLWVVIINNDSPVTYHGKPILAGLHLRPVSSWRTSDLWLQLYVRQ